MQWLDSAAHVPFDVHENVLYYHSPVREIAVDLGQDSDELVRYTSQVLMARKLIELELVPLSAVREVLCNDDPRIVRETEDAHAVALGYVLAYKAYLNGGELDSKENVKRGYFRAIDAFQMRYEQDDEGMPVMHIVLPTELDGLNPQKLLNGIAYFHETEGKKDKRPARSHD